MVTLAMIGLFFIALSAIVNALELRRFFKALGTLNNYTTTMKDRILYPFRLICLFRYLTPLIPDALFMMAGGMAGLGGGVLGFIIGLGGTCFTTLTIKFFMKISKPKKEAGQPRSYQEAIAQV